MPELMARPSPSGLADGIYGVAGTDVRRSHQLQMVEGRGGAPGILGGFGYLDDCDINGGIVIEHPLHAVAFAVKKNDVRLDGVLNGVVICHGQTGPAVMKKPLALEATTSSWTCSSVSYISIWNPAER